MTIEEDRRIIQEFANKHKIVFEDEGEFGIGRQCVGLRHGDAWIDYNPRADGGNYDWLEEFYDQRLDPPEGVKDAYHKHDCMAVLGRGDDAIAQLAIWVRHYNELGVKFVDRERKHADPISAALHGLTSMTVVVA